VLSTALTASCGSDELTGPPDDGNLVGGEGGANGIPTAGSGGRSGSGGGGGAPARQTDLGKACADDTACGGDLLCTQSASLPLGICSDACTTTAECQVHGPGVCDELNELCFEACTPGDLGLAVKCHNRDDLACRFVKAAETATTCIDDTDCAADELCAERQAGSDELVCFEILMGCLPTCGSDADCPDAFCDLSSGFCVEAPPEGLPLGAACDPDALDDPCQGLCIGSDGGTAFCSGYCRFSNTDLGCGVAPDATHAEGACLFASAISPNADLGDAGFCGQLCDCNEQCGNPALECIAILDGMGNQLVLVDRLGFCGTPGAQDAVLDECPSAGGAGGAGGAGAGGASGGEGGSSGGAGGASGSAN